MTSRAEEPDALQEARRCCQAGDFGRAERLFSQILQADPSHAHTWYLLGAARQELGRLDAAAEAVRESLRRRPGDAAAEDLLGVILARQQRFVEAEACFRRSLETRPDSAEVLLHHGCALRDLARPEEALGALERAILLQPDMPGAWSALTGLLAKSGKGGEAVAVYRRLAQGRPDAAEAHRNLGVAFLEAGRLDEAEAALQEALRLRPDAALIHNNLGMLRSRQGRLEEAAAVYAEAVRRKPIFHEAHNNLGNALRDLGRFDEAAARYDEALRLKPDYAGAHWNRALLRLLQGDLAEGWAEYEWRWRLPTVAPRRFGQPRWDGSPLDGRTILICAEQGLGDTLQFIRYLPLVQQLGGKVIFECPPALTRLLAGAAGVDQLIRPGDPPPSFDVQAPLLSLPMLFGTRLDSIPAGAPYLRADPRLVDSWRRELAPLGGFKIGVAWQGNPQYVVDHLRSIPLACFEPLARTADVRLISLQKGPGMEQLRQVGFPVIDFGERLDKTDGPFMDTAAVLTCVDLLAASDSAVLHLAGALGAPAWAALPFVPDWRWLLGREDSPWHPSLRLFRQDRPGDWKGVFERMADALGRTPRTQRPHGRQRG
jgi:tetratricopeptide (TPR) repeat protein